MRSLLSATTCRQWLYPGPVRVFTPDEMARAGQQPWPVTVDSFVVINLLSMLPLMLWAQHGRGWFTQTLWWLLWAGVAGVLLLISRDLWWRPTRRRLNLYCYAVAAANAVACIALIRLGHKDVVLALVAGMTGVLSGWWMLTIFRVQQIEARLRELADQDAALRLSTQLATAQIQPHFLFNTLASLQHWVDTQDPRAAPLLRDFTAYLRATLPMFERELQPLADEVEMVRRYLAIMQARMGTRLAVDLAVDPALDAALPPGTLLTLAENAITHGLEPQLHGGRLTLRARRDGAWLHLDVQDDGPGLAPGWTDGVGLSNTRRRLAQACPGATLTLANAHPGTLATLSLPLKT